MTHRKNNNLAVAALPHAWKAACLSTGLLLSAQSLAEAEAVTLSSVGVSPETTLTPMHNSYGPHANVHAPSDLAPVASKSPKRMADIDRDQSSYTRTGETLLSFEEGAGEAYARGRSRIPAIDRDQSSFTRTGETRLLLQGEQSL